MADGTSLEHIDTSSVIMVLHITATFAAYDDQMNRSLQLPQCLQSSPRIQGDGDSNLLLQKFCDCLVSSISATLSDYYRVN